MKETMQSLVDATHELSGKVTEFAATLEVSRKQSRRLRYLVIATCVLAVLSLLGVVGVFFTVQQNHANAVTSCENANQSRQAQEDLWNFVLSASANNPDRTPEQKKLSDDFEAWIHQLFAQRDCQDLSRVYEIPPPPTLPAP